MDYMKARIDSRLHIDLDSVGALTMFKNLLTYPNPKFQDAERMGFYTGNILPTLATWEFDPAKRELSVCRGETTRIRDALRIHGAQLYIEDISTVGKELPLMYYVNDDFALDERQERAIQAMCGWNQGIIHAATSAGKSAIILAAIARIKRKTLVIVHRKVLLEQLVADAKKWLHGATIGIVGDGKRDVADVTFCIDKSLIKALQTHPELFTDVGVVIQDECHLSPATTFQYLIDKLPARKRFGLTGTLKRKDRMEFLIHATFGNVIATITKDELEEAGRTTPVEVQVHETDTAVPDYVFSLSPSECWRACETAIHTDPERRLRAIQIVGSILHVNPQARILILSRYVDPCYEMGRLLTQFNIKSGVVTGKEDDHKRTCDELERGECSVIVATIGTVATGVNIKSLTDIILFSPVFSNELMLHQIRGRGMRVSPGKEKFTMHLMFDPRVFDEKRIKQAVRILRKS
jgi:superfamily II DNA or RNA helicase